MLIYANYYSLTLAFRMNFTQALANFTRMQARVCPGVASYATVWTATRMLDGSLETKIQTELLSGHQKAFYIHHCMF